MAANDLPQAFRYATDMIILANNTAPSGTPESLCENPVIGAEMG